MTDDPPPGAAASRKEADETPSTANRPAPRIGYGHRAHCPDPNAKYGFDPGAPRIIPHDKSKRWKVTG